MTLWLRLAVLTLATTATPYRRDVGAQVGTTQTNSDTQMAPVAARRLPRGTVLSESDILVARVATRGAIHQAVVAQPGWITRRVVQPGERLVPPSVVPAPLVSAGQLVRYVVEREGISLIISGRALTSGGLGDRVTVRLGTNRHLQGIVTGAGHVAASDSTRSS